MTRIAVFGGIYSNHLALAAALADAQARGVEAIYCLGDLGAFGPFPDRVFPLLREHGVSCIQGNYDNSIGNDLADCQCGYTDPRDNHFARISYAYTFANTSTENRAWMRSLPMQRRVLLGARRLLMCHGSPRKMNEFLWESTASTGFLDHLAREQDAEVILATHTGIKWRRDLAGGRLFVNVGVLGRPENDGTPRVWYAILDDGEAPLLLPSPPVLCSSGVPPEIRPVGPLTPNPSPPITAARGTGKDASRLSVEFVPVDYDHERLAAEMRSEHLPEEFVETVSTGWWTTCLEVLPAKERRRGRY